MLTCSKYVIKVSGSGDKVTQYVDGVEVQAFNGFEFNTKCIVWYLGSEPHRLGEGDIN